MRTVILAAALAASALAQMPRSTEGAVFFSGEVTMQDGSKPPEPVRIQRICKGTAQDETWTDSKGRFSFKVAGIGGDSVADSSQTPKNTDLSRPIGNSTYYSNPVTTALRDCQVQAVLAGFRSDRVSIAIKNTLDDTRIGTIVLHPMTGGQALVVSATTLAAPPNAAKAYEKGQVAMHDKKYDAALKEFEKAVALYPKYAIAWFELGRLRHSRGDGASAAEAWKQALASDPRYVRPYEGLAALAEQGQNWAELERVARDWIALDAENFPAAYLYRAVASAQMGESEQAEIAARRGLVLDKDHRIPRLNYVLGLILMAKGDLAESAKCLKAYLEFAPNAKDAPGVRAQLARIEASAPR